MDEQIEPEITDVPEPQEVEVALPEEKEGEAPAAEEKKFDPKKDKVEFDTPEQEARFNEIFRQLKKSDQRNAMLTDFLHQQSQILDGVRKDINQTNDSEAEKAILSKISKAREDNDDAAYDRAFAELVDYRTERKLEKKFDEKVNKILQQEKDEQTKQAEFVASLMSEKDDLGNHVRPWLQETHPDFEDVILRKLPAIAYKYINDPQALEKSLAELDRVMGGSMPKRPESNGQRRAPNPMQGSNLTNQNPKGKIKMTRKELDVLKQLERHSGRKIDLSKYAARRSAMRGQNG